MKMIFDNLKNTHLVLGDPVQYSSLAFLKKKRISFFSITLVLHVYILQCFSLYFVLYQRKQVWSECLYSFKEYRIVY